MCLTVLRFNLSFPLRSSPPKVFWKKDNLKILQNPPVRVSFFFNKITGASCNFNKNGTLAQLLSYEFCEMFTNIFLYKTPLVAASALQKFSKNNLRNKRTEK